ncbi:MAG: nuclear transport factor 2 family protein [Acidimicrobiaceae bacterium]|nr:nuclear transport factor 2 family protein [Acidimicrobiaceae bacterium]
MTILEHEAWELLRTYEKLFSAQDIPSILEGFTDDAEVIFADVPAIRGQAAIEQFLTTRFARQRDYTLTKTLRSVVDNVVIGTWEGDWTDPETGTQMQGRGAEILTLAADGRCARWEAYFNTWATNEERSSTWTTPTT